MKMAPEPTRDATRDATRDPTADLLKGTAVLLMMQVHIIELFARQDVLLGDVGRVLMFLGGPPVAPVFLAVLGFFALRSPLSEGRLVLRACQLIALGGVLNLGLNMHLLILIYSGQSTLSPWQYVFGVDVLFGAGLSLICVALLRPLFKTYVLAWAAASLLVAGVAPWFSEVLTTYIQSPWLTAYIASRASWSYFPLFPWLAYVLLGVTAFHVRERLSLSRRGAVLTLATSVPILLATGGFAFEASNDLPAFYHHGIELFLWNVVFIAAWVLLHRALASFGAAMSGLAWLGRHVTACYVIQWLLIGNIATAIYKTESLLHCALWLVTLVVVTIILAHAYEWLRRRSQSVATVVPMPSLPA